MLVGMVGTSYGPSSDPVNRIGKTSQSNSDLGVAGALLELGFERSLEMTAMQKSGPSPAYESVRARS